MMTTRLLTADEASSSLPIWSQAFHSGSKDVSEWKRFYRDRERDLALSGTWDAHGLQAVVAVQDYSLHFGHDVRLRMGGVQGVACLPAARGRGYAATTIRCALEHMRESGQVLSMLDAFSWEFYQRLGWDWIGFDRRYTVRTEVLPADLESENVRAAGQADRAAVRQVYSQFANRYRCMIARDDQHWAGILDNTEKNHTYSYLYESDGEPEGYLTYRGGTHEHTGLRDFICLTPRASRGLLGLLRRHAMQIKKVKWSAPADDGLWHRLLHWDVETKLRPKTMARIVDVAAALACWLPATERADSVVLRVHDDVAPWNDGSWLVENEGRSIAVRSTERAPELSMHVRALTQAFCGTPDLTALRANERLVVHDENGYSALCRMLSGPPAWLSDSF